MSQSYYGSTAPQSTPGTSGVITYTNYNALNSPFLKTTGQFDVNSIYIWNYFKFNTSPSIIPTDKGAVYYDSISDTLTLNLSNGVKLQFGEEMYIRAINNTGLTITDGQVVYLEDADTNLPQIALADNSDYENSKRTIGLATEGITDGNFGRITSFGLVRGIDTSAWMAGDRLYLSGTPGELTDTLPVDGLSRVAVGRVIISSATDGWIFVDVLEDKYMFGDPDNGNYSMFEADGTLKAVGDAKCTLDEFSSLIGQRLFSASGRIDYNYEEGTVDFQDNCTLDDYILMNTQINHDWDQESPIEFHLHWWQTVSGSPNWLYQYRWQVNGQPKTTSWTSAKFSNSVFSYTSGTILQISDFPGISVPSPIGVSSIIEVRLLRDTNNDSGLFSSTDNVAGDSLCKFFDAHKVVDTLGSREEYSK